MHPLLPISTSQPAQSLLNRWLRQFLMVLLLSGTLTSFLDLVVLPLHPFPQANLGDQSASGVLHQDLHGAGGVPVVGHD
jgi:hypothetical protein